MCVYRTERARHLRDPGGGTQAVGAGRLVVIAVTGQIVRAVRSVDHRKGNQTTVRVPLGTFRQHPVDPAGADTVEQALLVVLEATSRQPPSLVGGVQGWNRPTARSAASDNERAGRRWNRCVFLSSIPAPGRSGRASVSDGARINNPANHVAAKTVPIVIGRYLLMRLSCGDQSPFSGSSSAGMRGDSHAFPCSIRTRFRAGGAAGRSISI